MTGSREREEGSILRCKDEHLAIAESQLRDGSAGGTLLDCVHLFHEALPEVDVRDIDLRTTFMGKRLSAPIVLSGLTATTARDRAVDLNLARAAEAEGIALGLGSQRPMLERTTARETYLLRAEAPTAVIIGNLSLWQAREIGPDAVQYLMDDVGADAMAIHLNTAQELAQAEGGRDFRGGERTLATLARALGPRLLVKETGCGIGPRAAARLVDLGVQVIDVAGLGGTSWVEVERLRSGEGAAGRDLATWGIPTGACVAAATRVIGGRATLIASGGIRSGLDAARALALGAGLVGIGLPARARAGGGAEAVQRLLRDLVHDLRCVMALTGSTDVAALQRAGRFLSEPLWSWVASLEDDLAPPRSRPAALGTVEPAGSVR